jgi:hypothetical protein
VASLWWTGLSRGFWRWEINSGDRINIAWWFQPYPLWKIWYSQLGCWHSQLNGKIIQMVQTTKHIYIEPPTRLRTLWPRWGSPKKRKKHSFRVAEPWPADQHWGKTDNKPIWVSFCSI